jgi:hypothetical protein
MVSMLLSSKPITHEDVEAFVADKPVMEALRELSVLRDDHRTRMEQIFEQTALGLDYFAFQQAFGLFKETWYEREINEWVAKQSRLYERLSFEMKAIQAGIDKLLTV